MYGIFIAVQEQEICVIKVLVLIPTYNEAESIANLLNRLQNVRLAQANKFDIDILIIDDNNKKRELLACIHLQSYETLIDNDKIWLQICKHNDNFVYKPTDKLNIY